MSRIFISHSSANNDRAIQLRDWLLENGWDDVFLDLDPERGIAAGERWKEALQKAAQHCEAVIALVSPEWLTRPYCLAELNTAQLMGKKIIVLLIGSKPTDVPGDLKDAQYVDLINDPDAYTRLKEGLKRAGLDPASFPFAEGRRPYPGLAPLEEDDAALFFGRDAQIVRGLDKLRGLARAGVERMLIILGASGCGKSSFLRAGLWPRLKRDDRAWLPLPTIRPGRAVISGLVEALYRIINEAPFAAKLQKQELPRSRDDIKEFVTTRDDGLLKILAALRKAGHVPGLSGEETLPPTIVIPIDQGEELFNEDGGAEAKRFIEILTRTLAADPSALTVLTMRTDSFPQFQNNPVLATVPKDTFTLDMMLEGSYREVIEAPAALVKPKPLKIDPQLTEALLQDAAGQDALPLLAFTLRYLYDQYKSNDELNLGSYEKLGRLKGVIETTVKQALAELPKDKAHPSLIRMAFIPHLARVNPAGQFVRRVATLSEIPPEARPLIDRLAEARLLVKDRRTVGGEDVEVIEVAHEALLREWTALNSALLEEREFLIAKGQLEQDVAEWQATAEDRKKGALLAGNKLARARHWLIQRPQELTTNERGFIQASADAEATRRRWLRMAAASAFIVIAAFAAYAWLKKTESDERATEAMNNETVGFAGLSAKALGEGRPVDAVQLALAAWPREGNSGRPELRLTLDSLAAALPQLRERLRLKGHEGEVISAAFSPDGTRVVTASYDYTARVWDAATGAEIVVLKGHERAVSSAAFSPDGTRVVTASWDMTARVWDATTGAEVAVLKGHENWVNSAAFSPDGTRVVTASRDKTARVWDSATGAGNVVLKGHDDEIQSAAFSPDGTRVVTASYDRTARVWDAATGAEIGVLKGHEDGVNSAAFSPDGERVVTGSNDNTARLWDAATGAAIGVLKGHEHVVTFAAFSPDGTRVVTASGDKTARVWDAATGAEIAVLKGHEGPVYSAAFSLDGTRVVTASFDNTARVWDAATGAAVAVLKGHEDRVLSAAFSPDGTRVVTASYDNTARLWDTATGAGNVVIKGHDDEIQSAAFSPGGTRVVTASRDKTARVWDVATGTGIAVLKGHENGVNSATFSPDGTRVVTASGDKTARVWDAATGAEIAVLKGHEGEVISAAFSPDGTRVVTASVDKTARVWDAATGAEIAVLKGHEGPVFSAAFSPDGTRVVTASAIDGPARLWDAATGAELAVLKGHWGPIYPAAFSPDGTRVVTGSWDHSARLWDTATGAEIAVLKGHEKIINSSAFSPDGTRVVTASEDNTARVWDAATGAAIAELKGHENRVNSAAFSPDGTRVVTASDDKTARVWDAATGAEIAVLKGHEAEVMSAAFSPDGTRVVTASYDTTARMWDLTKLEKGDGFAIACVRLGNSTNLTDARTRYGLGEIAPICGDSPRLPIDPYRLK